MAGMFDWLSGQGKELSGGISKAMEDPNNVQMLGQIGQGISAGKSMGEVLNPTELIRNKVAAKAGGAVSEQNAQLMNLLFRNLSGGSAANPMPETGANPASVMPMSSALGENGMTNNFFDFMKNIPDPTPKGAEGPDTVTRSKTADGETITMKIPSKKNLSTYGTNVPLEAQPAGGGQSPFSMALRNQA